MPADFDRCVTQVSSQMMKDNPNMKPDSAKSHAFAICTAQLKKAGKSSKESVKDEKGEIVVAENVKVILNADIDMIQE